MSLSPGETETPVRGPRVEEQAFVVFDHGSHLDKMASLFPCEVVNPFIDVSVLTFGATVTKLPGQVSAEIVRQAKNREGPDCWTYEPSQSRGGDARRLVHRDALPWKQRNSPDTALEARYTAPR